MSIFNKFMSTNSSTFHIRLTIKIFRKISHATFQETCLITNVTTAIIKIISRSIRRIQTATHFSTQCLVWIHTTWKNQRNLEIEKQRKMVRRWSKSSLKSVVMMAIFELVNYRQTVRWKFKILSIFQLNFTILMSKNTNA